MTNTLDIQDLLRQHFAEIDSLKDREEEAIRLFGRYGVMVLQYIEFGL